MKPTVKSHYNPKAHNEKLMLFMKSGAFHFSCAFHFLDAFTFQVCFSCAFHFSGVLFTFHVLFIKSTSFHIKSTTFHENQQNQVNMCVYMYHLNIHAPHTPPNTTKI